MEWLKNLSNAINYIEDNLAEAISYEEAAKIACCSTYNFQRMFSYVAGISLSEYIRRRRMTQAAFELQWEIFSLLGQNGVEWIRLQ
jgi:AraC family transcriptional regulator